MDWYLKVLKNYFGFSGRARRKEFWMFCLINIIIGIVLTVAETVAGFSRSAGYGPVSALYSLAVFIPSLAVSFRRLHDTGRSGAWIFINLIPVLGWLVYLFFLVQDSKPGDNAYGVNPKAA